MKKDCSVRRVSPAFAALLLVLVAWPALAKDWIYTTVKGDNLWELSERYLDKVSRYEQVRKLNGIRQPKHIQPGTKIRIPLAWVRSNLSSAHVVALQGSGYLLHYSGDREPLRTDMPVQLGDELQTLQDTTVTVRFADSTVLTIQEHSVIRFDHLTAHGTTGMVDSRLRLVKGRANTTVTPAVGPGSRFQIETPSAISAVRGTRYRAAVSADATASNIEVLEGNVAVAGGGEEALVPAGYGTRVKVGEPPAPPRALLPGPQITNAADRVSAPGYVLTWVPVQEAVNYRLELSRSEHFETLVWQATSVQERLPLPSLPDGQYYSRLRAMDSEALEGLNTLWAFTLDAEPQPPLPLTPSDQATVRGEMPELQWSAAQTAHTYQLTLARDPEFKQTEGVWTGLTAPRLKPGITTPGVYYWRINSVAEDGEVGPASAPRQLQVRPLLDAVTAEVTAHGEGLVASWPTLSPSQRYQVQLAKDETFDDLILDTQTDQPQITLENAAWINRYLRVRAVEDDGYAGPWGTTQKIEGTRDQRWLLLLLPFVIGLF